MTVDEDRAKRMRDRAAMFQQMASESGDPVVHAELKRLVVLYIAQAERIETGEELPTDPGEQR